MLVIWAEVTCDHCGMKRVYRSELKRILQEVSDHSWCLEDDKTYCTKECLRIARRIRAHEVG